MTNKKMDPLNHGVDEALWAAYRREDKPAVMDYLFRRSLIGIGRLRSFPQLVIQSRSNKRRAARCNCGARLRINGGAREILLRSRLN